MVSNVTLSASLRAVVNSLKGTARTIDVVTARLASGQKVNSAIDSPQNFFTALSLKNDAFDHGRLLDGVGQSLRTIEEAVVGLKAIDRLIDQAESISVGSKELLDAGEIDPQIVEEVFNNRPPPLSSQISQSNPDVYFRLNETGGPIVDFGGGAAGPVGANYNSGATAGAAALYTNGSAPSVQFDGVNDRIRVNDSSMINTSTTPARTIELVFSADNVAGGRQVLYEEGGLTNGLTIYIDSGILYVTGEDDQGGQRFNDININAPIVSNQAYHVALVYDGAAQTFAGYLDGVNINTVSIATEGVYPAHGGNIGIGGMNDKVQFHDGESDGSNGFNFQGRISDVAIYNRILSDSELFSHADSLNATTTTRYGHADYENTINQIDQIVEDTHYRGVPLLRGGELETVFNPSGSSILVTKGKNLSSDALGLPHYDFNDADDLQGIIDSIRATRKTVRQFTKTLILDLNVIATREEFIFDKINTHLAGADDLTLADMNKEGANMLALQTRETLSVTALSLSSRSMASILRIF